MPASLPAIKISPEDCSSPSSLSPCRAVKRFALIYVLPLVFSAICIWWVLSKGATLPAPLGTTAAMHHAPVSTAHEPQVDGLSRVFADPLSRLFLQLLVIIGISQLVGTIFSRLGQTAVVGEMAAGILLGPSVFGSLFPTGFHFVFPAPSLGVLQLLSQIGVCLFMFVVGMEVDIRQLRGKAPTALVVSHVSIVLPYLLGVMLAYFLYTRLAAPGASFAAFALFLGISMSITAFPVLARILKERGLTRTTLGSVAVTCAAVDDVTAWSILAFVVAIAQAASVHASALTVGWVLLFAAVMIWGVRRLLPHCIGPANLARETPSRASLGIIVCLVVASALCTEAIGIHALFGAFLAGAIMPDTANFRHKLSVRIESFSAVLLLPLFFAFTGLRTQIGLLNSPADWLLCGLIVAIATLGKMGGSAAAARLTGMNWNESLQLGALMNTRGLMELIALNIGYDLGILSPRIFAMLVIMALVTTMLTNPLLSILSRAPSATGTPMAAQRS